MSREAELLYRGFEILMASLLLASMWQTKTVKNLQHGYSTSGIANACRFVSCKFSKPAGPVRYIPKYTKLPNHLEGENKNSDGTFLGTQRNFEELDMDSDRRHVRQKDNKLSSAQRLQCNEELPEQKRTLCRGRIQVHNPSSKGRDITTRTLQRSFMELPTNVHTSEENFASSRVGLYDASAIEDDSESFIKSSDKSRLCFNKIFVSRCSSPSTEQKNPEEEAADIKGREGPVGYSSQNIESFLAKVQQANRRTLETHTNGDTVMAGNGHFGIDEIRTCSDEDGVVKCLTLGQETIDDGYSTTEETLDVRSTVAQERAKNMALRYLSMRPYTAFQLRKKLESQKISSELSDYAVGAIQRSGLQSDLAYAETFSRARFNHGSWGPKKIKQGLRQRGISDGIIQEAIASVFQVDEDAVDSYGRCSKSSSTDMSQTALKHLLLHASKQWSRGQNATNETKVRRMVGWLQYRGYNYGIIKMVLNYLQKEIRIEEDI